MKTTCRWLALFASLFCFTLRGWSALPIPDLIFYGKVYPKSGGASIVNPVTIDITATLNSGNAVVAQVTELVSAGDPLLRDFYVLRVSREDGTLRTLADHSLTGDVLHLYLNGEEVLETSAAVVTVSGNPRDVRRLDLNAQNNPGSDSDADGLPDDWELTFFSSLTAQSGPGDANKDGVTNFVSYVMGLDPRQSAGGKMPSLEKEGGNFVFYFRKSKTATGVDYFVQKSPSLGLGSWQVVVGTLTFVSAEADSEIYKMTIPAGADMEMFFRLMAVKR